VLILAAAVVACGLAAAVVMLALPRSEPSGVARSLQLIRGPLEVADAVPPGLRSRRQRVWEPLLSALGRLGLRITPVGTPQRLRRRLDLAGNAGSWTSESLLAGKAAATIIFGGAGFLIWSLRPSWTALLLFAGLAALGYWITDVLLYNAGQKRQEAIRRHAPDALDMLTICVEAGLGFDAALAQVATKTSGPLSQEFARVLKEVQMGRSRADAFADLTSRTDVAEISTFVAAVVQADRLGVPVAGVLREQAAELRLRRRQRAEEKAQKVPVKIVFPVLFCIFPVFFVIVIGPGAIRIAQVFVHG